jgi:hypothetical protein
MSGGQKAPRIFREEISMAIISDIQMSKNGWFCDGDTHALTTTFAGFTFGFPSFSITLFNDAGNGSIEYSFDGTTFHGRVKAGEVRKMDYCRHSGIWLRTEDEAGAYRLEVY